MNNVEARFLLGLRLESYRRLPYAALLDLRGRETQVFEVVGESGDRYTLEFDVFWEDRMRGFLRVIGAVDTGRGWRAFFPLTDDWIAMPEAPEGD